MLALVAAGLAMYAWSTGGFRADLGYTHVSIRNPVRPAILAVLAFVAYVITAGCAQARDDLGAWLRRLARLLTPARLAGTIALAVVVVGTSWNSRVGGGADSYGYVSQADLWLHGSLITPQPFALQVPWPDALRTFVPLGYNPSLDGTGLVPNYSSGFPILMAVAKLFGGHGAMFGVVPLCGGLLIVATFGIGRRLGSDWIGLAAAWLLATSPIFLVMLMHPMSDVPTAAFWTAAVYCLMFDSTGSAFVAGLSAALAILVRPNLAPIAVLLTAWIAVANVRSGVRHRINSAVAFGVGVIPGCLAVAWLNTKFYGSPARSGYGDFGQMFSLANVGANLSHWWQWLAATASPLFLVACLIVALPTAWLWVSNEARCRAMALSLVAVGVAASYVLYIPFDGWWFLRFLLPGMPPVFLALGAVFVRLAAGKPRALWRMAAASAVLFLGVWSSHTAEAREAFVVRATEERYVAVARMVAAATDANSVIISSQHSGSVRLYGGRVTLRYEFLNAEWLDQSIDWLMKHGARPYILLDAWELPQFRQKFGPAGRIGQLDVPLVGAYDRQTFLYDPVSGADNGSWVEIPKAEPLEHCPLPAAPPTLVFRPSPAG